MPFLYSILAWFARFFVTKVLAMLAVGVFTYAIVQFFFEKYINTGLQMMGALPSDAWAYVTLFKLDKSISVILGAWAIRAAIAAVKTIATKV